MRVWSRAEPKSGQMKRWRLRWHQWSSSWTFKLGLQATWHVMATSDSWLPSEKADTAETKGGDLKNIMTKLTWATKSNDLLLWEQMMTRVESGIRKFEVVTWACQASRIETENLKWWPEQVRHLEFENWPEYSLATRKVQRWFWKYVRGRSEVK